MVIFKRHWIKKEEEVLGYQQRPPRETLTKTKLQSVVVCLTTDYLEITVIRQHRMKNNNKISITSFSCCPFCYTLLSK